MLGSSLERDEEPIVDLEIDSFFIDQYEVTVAQYDACIEEGFVRIFQHTVEMNIYNMKKTPAIIP